MSFGITNCQYKSILVKLMEENVLLCAFISHFFCLFSFGHQTFDTQTHIHTFKIKIIKSECYRICNYGIIYKH